MPESKTDIAEKRKSEDTALCLETCNTVCDENILSSEIIKSRRLGPRHENKPRPLRIKHKCESPYDNRRKKEN